MVHNGEGKCRMKTFSGVEEKTIVQDETVYQKVVSFLLFYNFKCRVWL